jgi:ABC-2 type transport system permease protein
VRPYLAYLAAGFRRWSAYRLAAAAGAFTNSVFGLVKASITVAAIGAAGGTLPATGCSLWPPTGRT